MSGKNFRVAPAGQRTNTEGKQVSNRVLLATPDSEYELMRPDLTYIDLPHHLSLHDRHKRSSSSISRTGEWFLKW